MTKQKINKKQVVDLAVINVHNAKIILMLILDLLDDGQWLELVRRFSKLKFEKDE